MKHAKKTIQNILACQYCTVAQTSALRKNTNILQNLPGLLNKKPGFFDFALQHRKVGMAINFNIVNKPIFKDPYYA